MKREIGQLLLGCAAGALLITAMVQWLAWQGLSQSQRYVNDLAETGWIEDEQAWRRHYEALQTRRLLVPFDAGIHRQLGELHRWRAMGMRLWPEQQQPELEAAKRQYLRAVEKSPFNGELLARVADRLAQANDPLAVPVLKRALELAPYEPVAQYHLSGAGLRYWDELDAPVKRSFQKMLSHAMANAKLAGNIRKMARNQGRVDVLDALGTDEP